MQYVIRSWCAIVLLLTASAAAQTTPVCSRELLRAPRAFSIQTSSVWSALADLNGDGARDLVSLGLGDIEVRLANGQGGYPSSTIFLAPDTMVSAPEVADADGDGLEDLFIGLFDPTGGNARVAIYHGDVVSGAVPGPLVTLGGDQLRCLHVADIDGSGEPDILACTSTNFGTTNNLEILLADGVGGFVSQAPTAISLGAQFKSGDIDGDGVVDLVVGVSNEIRFRRGLGAGSFGPSIVLAQTPSLWDFEVVDLDGDGVVDVVGVEAAPSGTRVFVLQGTGQGQFASVARSPLPAPAVSPLRLQVLDFDADGALDLGVVGDALFHDSLHVLFGDGLGSLGAGVSSRITHGSSLRSAPLVDDADADGRVDVIVLGTLVGTVVSGEGDGTLCEPPVFSSVGLAANDADIIDVDLDGAPDLVVAASNFLAVHAGDGQGNFGPAQTLGSPILRFATADLNGDMFPDIIGASPQAFEIFLSDGAGGFQAPSTVPASGSVGDLDVGDVDGDGEVDLAVVHGQAIQIYLGSGGGVFAPSVSLNATHPGIIRLARVDTDPHLDIVSRQGFATGAFEVFLGDGQGGFGAPMRFLLPGRDMELGDVNADGLLDLLSTEVPGAGHVLLGDGLGGFAAPLPLALGEGSSIEDLADFDGDGHVDVLSRGSFTVQLLLGNGTGAFSGPESFSVATLLTGRITSGDVDLNGTPDVIAYGTTSTVLLNGAQTLRGTGEDLILRTRPGLTGTGEEELQVISGGEPFDITWTSPGATFVGEPTVLIYQAFGTGAPPASLPGFPQIHVNPFILPAPEVVLTVLLPSNGFTLVGQAPFGASGFSVVLQAFATTANAANGIFAATNAQELRFL